MRQIAIPTQIDRLRYLAERFDALSTQLTDDTPLTGTDGLRQLGPRITESQVLVGLGQVGMGVGMSR